MFRTKLTGCTRAGWGRALDLAFPGGSVSDQAARANRAIGVSRSTYYGWRDGSVAPSFDHVVAVMTLIGARRFGDAVGAPEDAG